MSESFVASGIGFFKRRFLPKYYVRPSTGFISGHFDVGSSLVGVEIGTQYGYNAFSILNNLSNVSCLFLVDPYKSYPDYDEGWASDDGVDAAYRYAKNLLFRFRSRIVFVKKFSVDAVADVPDNLDFVYIDGNHSYDYVKKDLSLYYPKIKSGGVLCGHDFATHELGVCRAVVEFCNKHSLELFGRSYDWWVVKK